MNVDEGVLRDLRSFLRAEVSKTYPTTVRMFLMWLPDPDRED